MNKSVEYKLVDNYESENHACIILKIDRLKLIIIAIYRPPSLNANEFLDFLDEKINSVIGFNYKCILIGDMNIDLLNNNLNCDRIKDLYNSNNFKLCNLQYPTRHSNNNNSLLDHIAINFDNKINLYVISNYLSDHDIQLVDIDMKKNRIPNKKAANKFIQKINYELLQVNLNNLEEDINDNSNANDIYNSIINSYANCTYKKKIKIKNDKPWFNENLYHLIKQRDYYFQRKKIHPNNKYIKKIYDDYSKLVKQNVRRAKINYFRNTFDNLNHRNIWRSINFAISNRHEEKSNEVKTLNINNKTISDSKEICEHFNNFFVNIGKDLASKIPISNKNYTEKMYKDSMTLIPTDKYEIMNVIDNLNTKKSCGFDNISINMIKKSKRNICNILELLINNSFQTGIIPDKTKIAKITPIFKNGNKEHVTNYRPISVLPIISKIMEKIMNKRLLNFLQKSKFFYPNQYGFRKNSNSETAVVDITSDIQLQLDKKQNCGIISLDLCKAFDTVNHEILLKKMYDIGIRGNSYNWFKNYLTNRYQFVSINNHSSSYKKIICGVPQGSVLAPSLFLIYINSICSLRLKGTIKLFADDTTIFYYGKNFDDIRNNMVNDLEIIWDWLKFNKLSINISKSSFMFISKQNIKLNKDPIMLDGQKIIYCNYIKFLGLYIDENLTWKIHINKVKEKIVPYVGIISKIRHYLPLKQLKLVYFSFIYSHLQYLVSVWGTAPNTHLNQLRTLQNKAIKFMYKLSYLEPTINLYVPNNLLDINNLYKYRICIYIFSIIHKEKHSSVILTYNNNIHTHHTRQENNLTLINIHSNVGKKSVHFLGIKTYNQLPTKLKEIKTISTFKNKLKKFLIDH